MADYSDDFEILYDAGAPSCRIRFRCFDTPNSVAVPGCDVPDPAVEDLLVGVRRLCLGFHGLWSFSLPGSDIARMNGPCSRARVDGRTAELVAAMGAFHETEPAFDFTIGPASFLWKHAERVPGADEVAEALSHVGAGLVRVEGDVVVKADPLVQIDVGGAAKGFAADAVATMLREAGVESANVDLGGNLFMLGSHPSARPWRVAVRVPAGVEAERVVLEVRDKSVVTSGSYERFVEIDGVRYQHIIDARTGWPAETDLVSATVVADSSLDADLLATTALLAGSDGLDALAARHPGCGFLGIKSDGEVIRRL